MTKEVVHPDAICGQKISLRPATLADRQVIYNWLAHSDLTSLMLGEPHYPENPVPTWDEFIEDYETHFFDGSQTDQGMSFIIALEGKPIGHINYNTIIADTVELDIWLCSSKYTGKGYGVDALITLSRHLNKTMGCNRCIIAPSVRNINAVRAYEKAGFSASKDIPTWFTPDYPNETVVMSKDLAIRT